jgi:hypothetical protein
MRILRTVLVTALVTFAIIAAFMCAGGRAYLLKRLSGWHEWADFTVPSDALPLRADVKVNPPRVVICNTGNGPWKHSLVRITDGYLAEIDELAEGKCRDFDLNDFRTNSWKKMPPPKGLVIKDVEILTSVTEKAYLKRSVGSTE